MPPLNQSPATRIVPIWHFSIFFMFDQSTASHTLTSSIGWFISLRIILRIIFIQRVLMYAAAVAVVGQVAIDFTASNGNPRDRNSLHYNNQSNPEHQNPYEQVLWLICNNHRCASCAHEFSFHVSYVPRPRRLLRTRGPDSYRRMRTWAWSHPNRYLSKPLVLPQTVRLFYCPVPRGG